MRHGDQFPAPEEGKPSKKKMTGKHARLPRACMEREASSPSQTGCMGCDLYSHKGSKFKEPLLCQQLEILFFFKHIVISQRYHKV